ncbi:hypothetical protein [Microbacterium sp. JZ37]|uniref:hypothetical protein n=1 Tax=Microbacterium sp. JZ37 TaxID=2654193 RepID=UPI002B4621D8|nr:hypothetical protein [Microbacterium sp. JZ37]WRH16324.1 hypothetical protein GC092_01515 [Microbacterium sp. JZ37]
MIGVDLASARESADRFRVAAIELPLTVGPGRGATAEPGGAGVVVVDGADGWVSRLRDALARSSRSTSPLVAEPVSVPAEALDVLGAAECAVERERLRPLPDQASRAAAAARAVVVEAALPIDAAAEWLRDAIGWGRVLAGPLVPSACTRSSAGVLALLATPHGVPVTLLAGATSGHPAIVARTLGEQRVEVRVDPRGVDVRIASADGELVLPRGRESAARAALRRAVHGGATDLSDLVHDERVRAVLSEGN